MWKQKGVILNVFNDNEPLAVPWTANNSESATCMCKSNNHLTSYLSIFFPSWKRVRNAVKILIIDLEERWRYQVPPIDEQLAPVLQHLRRRFSLDILSFPFSLKHPDPQFLSYLWYVSFKGKETLGKGQFYSEVSIWFIGVSIRFTLWRLSFWGKIHLKTIFVRISPVEQLTLSIKWITKV